MVRKLTDKQRAVYQLIEDFWRSTKVSPSVTDLSDALGLRRSTTYKHLMALKKKGMLVHMEGRGMSWIPVSRAETEDEKRVPILGQAPAGPPQEAIESAEGWVIEENPPGSGNDLFALHVRGDSMIRAGIFDGDLVIIRHQDTAEVGDIVVVLIDGEETTIKRLERIGPRIRLKPENPELEPIELEASRVRIQGKIVGLRRRYE